ncbi:MAG TPA: zf-HC2 domain-containing protein [Anaerolineales bacterium]|nr:zf-HC2 domain-containing protein [Anaerolineales bacterium]
MLQWLGAYQDGELSPARCQALEAHLAACAACRAELEALRSLSTLLHLEPDPAPSLSGARFAAQVGLRLPRRAAEPAWQKALRLGWAALPALVLVGWAFVQALSLVAGPVMWALQVGLGGTAFSQALNAPSPLTGLGGLFGLPGAVEAPQAAGTLGWLNGFLQLLALQVGAMLLAGILLGGWLASWWASRREQVDHNHRRLL